MDEGRDGSRDGRRDGSRWCSHFAAVRHATRAAAKRHLDRLRRARGFAGKEYACLHCGGWHVGRLGPALVHGNKKWRLR